MEPRNGWPDFGSHDVFENIARDELGHTFVNPIVEKHMDKLMSHAALFEPVSKLLKPQGYSSWRTCVIEHTVRAAAVRLTALDQGSLAGENALLREKSRGFAYPEDLCRSLLEYEKHRDIYPTFRDFYPELLKTWDRLAEAPPGPDYFQVPFSGTVASVKRHKENVVYIIPTSEENAQAQEKIRQDVTAIRERFNPGAPIITDRESLTKDLG